MDETSELTEFQEWERCKLDDIDHDTDSIMDMMGGEKMAESFDSGMLAGLLSNKGIDPGIVAMLNDKARDGSWGENGGIWIILLFLFLLGVGGNGLFGNRDGSVAGVDRTVVNEANYSRMLDAISTQGTRQEMAVQSLANTLNCDVNLIQSALAGVDKQLAVNQGSIINAIQSCCCNVTNAVNSTACATQRAIESSESAVLQSNQETRYLIQTTDAATRQLITQKFCDQNAYLAEQFCAIKTREDQREIQALRDKLQEQREEANTRAILTAISYRDRVTGTVDADAGTFAGNIGRAV